MSNGSLAQATEALVDGPPSWQLEDVAIAATHWPAEEVSHRTSLCSIDRRTKPVTTGFNTRGSRPFSLASPWGRQTSSACAWLSELIFAFLFIRSFIQSIVSVCVLFTGTLQELLHQALYVGLYYPLVINPSSSSTRIVTRSSTSKVIKIG